MIHVSAYQTHVRVHRSELTSHAGGLGGGTPRVPFGWRAAREHIAVSAAGAREARNLMLAAASGPSHRPTAAAAAAAGSTGTRAAPARRSAANRLAWGWRPGAGSSAPGRAAAHARRGRTATFRAGRA